MTYPRQKDIAVSTVKNLRASDALAEEIYRDTTPPTDPADRDRIFAGHPAQKKDDAVLIGVDPVSAGSTAPKSGVYVVGTRVQLTIAVAESYYERHGTLVMHSIRDECATVLEKGAPKQYPEGSEGGGTIEPSNAGYRQLVEDFRVTTIHG